jgi:hypothetical protein
MATTPTTDDTPPTSSLTSNAHGVDGGWDDDERGRWGRRRRGPNNDFVIWVAIPLFFDGFLLFIN